METICGTQTVSEMVTIYGLEITTCVVIGKNTFSLTPRRIGTAIGTAIVTIGGMVTNAPSLTERG
jgi:hypothetical protein